MTLKQRWHNLMANQELKDKLYKIVFGSETEAGKKFDIILIIAIILSILIVMCDSLFRGHPWILASFVVLEYVLTIFFTIEYIVRLYCSPKPRAYALSFFGIIDLVSILPMYLGFFLHGARYMLLLRSFRLIRVFRIFKLFAFLEEGHLLLKSIRNSLNKMVIFFLFVVIVVICLGTVMFIVENGVEGSQYTDIPTSIYWAVVTMTTVGYGDITPVTSVGRFFSTLVMLLGYTTMAVPPAIVTSEMVKNTKKQIRRVCPNCGRIGHDKDALYCKYCGSALESIEKKQ
ncbi:MAG: ion transporter [Bacteroidales bacterium]|nr:ion transporter [Bacteroidales bacterium]